jgi:hypothetical protein
VLAAASNSNSEHLLRVTVKETFLDEVESGPNQGRCVV